MSFPSIWGICLNCGKAITEHFHKCRESELNRVVGYKLIDWNKPHFIDHFGETYNLTDADSDQSCNSDKVNENEKIMLKPFNTSHDYVPRCVKCHKKLKTRKPTRHEQESHRDYYRAKYDINIAKPEDVYLISDQCSCGQYGLVFFIQNSDLEK